MPSQARPNDINTGSKNKMNITIKKMALLLLLAVLILIAIIGWRTSVVSKPQINTQSPAKLVNLDAQEMAQNLSKAIQFQTVTQQNRDDTNWPVFLEFQNWLKSTYPDFHAVVQTEQIETYAQFHTWQGTDASLDPIVFLAHQDVVPALETDAGWDFPPFSGAIENGYVYGRGTIDDKGSLIGILEAANRLAQDGFKPKRTLMFAFGHDEEVLGSGAKAIAALLKVRGVTPYAVIDEGGAITTGMPDVKGPVARIGVAEKGYVTLILTATGQGGHSSSPPSYTAIGGLSKAIAAIEANPFERGLDPVIKAMLTATAPEQEFKGRMAIANLWAFGGMVETQMAQAAAGRAMMGTTIAPTIIDAGFKENALPRTATAYVNFRVHSRDSIQSVTEHVRRVINDPNIKISQSDNIGSEPSPVSQFDAGPYLWLKQAVQATFPDTIVAPNTVIGGTDSRYFSVVTNDIYRFAPFVLDATDLARFHGLNERMAIDTYVKGVQVYHLMLTKAGNGEEDAE